MDDIFAYPAKEDWDKREKWIDNTIFEYETGCYLVSEHSTALFFDMRRAYCSGAWISVVVLAVSVIDAHFRETESGDNKINTAQLLKEYYKDDEIEWLRKLRNKYVHLNLDRRFLEMDTWFYNSKQLEIDTTKAMLITIKTFFNSQGV